ncbi:hypothetical protein [Nocardioides ferulae]|uniref:hypothetical protein n=1 Tax=Nocardioides ferulae TaxID=2340821 RepID=UPI000EAF62B0|nr:hypothetical protein [Nocardioides ferulae]
MTHAFVETPHERAENRLALFAAIFLGLAATMTAFSAYQGALKDGEALAGYTQSTSALTEANRLNAQATQIQTGDRQLFVEYATTLQDDAPTAVETADYLLTLMRPELVEAIEWWLDTDDAITPFDEIDGNPYTLVELEQAEQKSAESVRAFDEAAAADDTGDDFELSTVLLAITLFFGGIATLFSRYVVSVSLLVVSGLSLVAGAVQLAMAAGVV